MKVNIDQTLEVTDEQRKAIAATLGQKTATREDLKAFIWQHGARWEIVLGGEEFTEDDANVNGVGEDDEDLIGGIEVHEAEGSEDVLGVVDPVKQQIAEDAARYEAALARAHENLRAANDEDLI